LAGRQARRQAAAAPCRQRQHVVAAAAASATPATPSSAASSSSSAPSAPTDIEYDAVIIGSGMGGLSTAAQMAAKGAKVVVLEK
jgi:prolycopene isomerase